MIAVDLRRDGSTLRAAAGLLATNGAASVALLVAMRCAGLQTRANLVADTLASAERARLHLVPGKTSDEAAANDALARSFARSAVQALAHGVDG